MVGLNRIETTLTLTLTTVEAISEKSWPCLIWLKFIYLQTDHIREVPGKSKWKFKMAFAIRRPTPPPLMAKFPDIFLPHFFSFAIESYIYETDFTLQKYHF